MLENFAVWVLCEFRRTKGTRTPSENGRAINRWNNEGVSLTGSCEESVHCGISYPIEIDVNVSYSGSGSKDIHHRRGLVTGHNIPEQHIHRQAVES